MLETIILIITTSVVFLLGIIVGFRLSKGQAPVELPKVEEIKKHIPLTKENKVSKQEEKEIERLNTIWENINNYSGSNDGQRSVK